MDFVVAGFGIGAILALIGFAIWELFGIEGDSGFYWKAGAGISLMLAAVALWAVTLVALVAGAGDSAGWQLVGFTALGGLAASSVFVWWLRHLHGLPLTLARSGRDRSNQPIAGDADNEWDTWPEWAPQPETNQFEGIRHFQEDSVDKAPAATAADVAEVESAEVDGSEVQAGAEERAVVAPARDDDPVRLTFGDPAEIPDAPEGGFESPLLADLAPDADTGDHAGFRSELLNALADDSNQEAVDRAQKPAQPGEIPDDESENPGKDDSETLDAAAGIPVRRDSIRS